MVTSPNYSGLNAGSGMVRDGGEKATQSLQELNRTILEADKFKYTERKKEESDFLEAIKTKPEFVISAKAREDQAKALTTFNQRYAPLIKKGYLTMEEKTAMANDRAALEAMQQQQLAHYQQYLGMKEAMLKDTQGRFDKDEFLEWESDYQQSGQFDHATMPLKGVNPYIYFQKNPVLGTEELNETTGMRTSGTVPESMAHIRAHVYTNEELRIGLIKEFHNLPDSVKEGYYDTNKDGTVSPQESQAGQGVDVTNPENPILKYAYDKYKDIAIKKDALKKAKTGSTQTAAEKKGKKQVQVANSTIDMSPGRRATVLTYGDKKYSKLSFQFGESTVLYGIPTQGFERVTGTVTDPDPAKGIVNGRLRLYDPQGHVFLIELVGTSESGDTSTGTLIEIPEQNIDGYQNIYVTLGDVPLTINEYKDKINPVSLKPNKVSEATTTETPTPVAAPTATPTKDWSKYKR